MRKDNYTNFNLIIFALTIFSGLFFATSCDEPSKNKSVAKTKTQKSKEGLVTTKYPDGKVHTEVNYKGGRKNGISTSYFNNGNKQLEMTYVNGKRSGVSRKYYENGKIYAETPYVNNKISGIRKTYYSDGVLKAETPYENSLMGVGTKQYSNNGNLIDTYQLKIKKIKKKNYEVSVNNKCRKITFFEGKLVNGKYLDESVVIALPMSSGKGIFNNKYNQTDLNFICKCITPGNTTLIINKAIKAY